jgi:hypothetical protein
MRTREHLAKRREGCKVPREGVILTVASISEVMDTTKSFGYKSSRTQLNISYVNSITASVVQCSEFLAVDPEVRVLFMALPDFLSSGSGTGCTQSREYSQ